MIGRSGGGRTAAGEWLLGARSHCQLKGRLPQGVAPTDHCSAVPPGGLAASTVSVQAEAGPSAASGYVIMHWEGHTAVVLSPGSAGPEVGVPTLRFSGCLGLPFGSSLRRSFQKVLYRVKRSALPSQNIAFGVLGWCLARQARKLEYLQ